MYTNIYNITHTHTHTHTYTHTHIYTNTHTDTHTHIYTYTHIDNHCAYAQSKRMSKKRHFVNPDSRHQNTSTSSSSSSSSSSENGSLEVVRPQCRGHRQGCRGCGCRGCTVSAVQRGDVRPDDISRTDTQYARCHDDDDGNRDDRNNVGDSDVILRTGVDNVCQKSAVSICTQTSLAPDAHATLHTYYIIVITSPVLYHLYYIIRITLPVLHHNYYITCITSSLLHHHYYITCITSYV